jgi:hypothetical protein
MFNFSSVRRPLTIALALTSSIAIVACNDKTAPKPTPTVTAVTVTAPATTLAVGATTQATATVTGTNTPAQTVNWTTSNADVARVSSTGLITAVSAGTAVITATSTVNTAKSGTVTITVTGGGTGLTTAKINFAPANAPAVAGYTINSGAAYTAASMTGWVTEASVGTATPVPLDMTNNTRNRGPINGVTDPRQYTQINMQCNNQLTGNPCSGSSELRSGAFQYKVVNGKYNVTVGVGEASTDVNSVMQINLESGTANAVTVLSGFVPTATNKVLVKSATVTVADGMLTVDAKGGNNTKINFIDIAPAPAN